MYKAHLDTIEKSSPPQPVTIINNVPGNNARVNINSTDNSINSNSQTSHTIFANLMEVTSSISDDAEKRRLQEAILKMEKCHKTEGFISSYKDFIAVASNHMTLFAPLLPALATLL